MGTSPASPDGQGRADEGRSRGLAPKPRSFLELDRILRLPQVLEVTGLPTSSLYRQMETGSFPRPVRLGKNTVGWRSSAVQAWLDGLEVVTTKPKPEAEGEREATAHRSQRNSGRQSVGNR